MGHKHIYKQILNCLEWSPEFTSPFGIRIILPIALEAHYMVGPCGIIQPVSHINFSVFYFYCIQLVYCYIFVVLYDTLIYCNVCLHTSGLFSLFGHAHIYFLIFYNFFIILEFFPIRDVYTASKVLYTYSWTYDLFQFNPVISR